VDIDTVKTVAMWALIVIAVVGILLAIVIKKIIGKIISLVLAAVLVFFCWQQRDKVMAAANDLQAGACSTANAKLPSFFGIRVSLPDDWCTAK
jgi:c-di-AMP phosphodiesterase-like protein